MSSNKVHSLVELAKQWEAEQRQSAETVAELLVSMADMEAGRGRPLADIAAEMRKKFNIPAGDA